MNYGPYVDENRGFKLIQLPATSGPEGEKGYSQNEFFSSILAKMLSHVLINRNSMFKFCLTCFLLQFSFHIAGHSQQTISIFKDYYMEEIPGNSFGEIHISKDGSVLVSAKDFSFAMISGAVFTPFTIGLSKTYNIKNIKNVFYDDPMKNIAESGDRNIFFTNANNQITFFKNTETGYCDLPPFYFPLKGEPQKTISKLWFDDENNLYIGVTDETFYIVPKGGANYALDSNNYKIANTKDSGMVILKGELTVKKILVPGADGIFSFAQHRTSKGIIWLGTGNGLYKYIESTGEVSAVYSPEKKTTITHLEILANGNIWLSTLEKGMGVYDHEKKQPNFYNYPKKQTGNPAFYPVQNFFVKSPSEFFVAVKDSFPAIFNINDGSYKFINDPLNAPYFILSKNSTTDIKIDSSGNFYFIKGGLLFSAHVSDHSEWIGETTTNITSTPLVYQITDLNKRQIADYYTQPDLLKKITLNYRQNSIVVYYTSNNFSIHKKTQFAWMVEGSDINYWFEMPVLNNNNDSTHIAELVNLKPGNYVLRVKMRFEDGDWGANEARMEIIITPPYWTMWWFWASIIAVILLTVYIIVKLRVRAVRKTERLKARYEKELLELEAKALRAQMNPHFVFNCLNSIKALMQENQNEKGVTYLTTFSKLIRTLFNNADKKEISMYDEIETCKFYLQLEAMRFDEKFSYSVNVSENMDLKSIQVPALIVQPFIENAIWHGIVPRGSGNVGLSVLKENGDIQVIIEDDGIGREASQQNKSASGLTTHQSKGVNLTQSRLKLDNLLQQRRGRIETIDKKDESGKATGTKVILTINEET